MITAGTVLVEKDVGIEYLADPTIEEWNELEQDRAATAPRTLWLYTMDYVRQAVISGQIACYEITEDQIRVGSYALEVVTHEGDQYLNVIWLRVEPGKFSRNVRDAVLASWRAVAEATAIDNWAVMGRPGWEHVLTAAGLKPVELSRFWTFKTGNLP